MQFDFGAAQKYLSQANKHFGGLLPSTGPDGTPAPTFSQHAVAEHAKAYVDAVAGLQQQFALFAAPDPGNRKQALEQEVQALQQELERADQLLLETNNLVQQWQASCHDLRDQHEAALTQGISNSKAHQP